MGLLEDYLAYQQAMQSLMAEPIPGEAAGLWLLCRSDGTEPSSS